MINSHQMVAHTRQFCNDTFPQQPPPPPPPRQDPRWLKIHLPGPDFTLCITRFLHLPSFRPFLVFQEAFFASQAFAIASKVRADKYMLLGALKMDRIQAAAWVHTATLYYFLADISISDGTVYSKSNFKPFALYRYFLSINEASCEEFKGQYGSMHKSLCNL